VALIELVKQCIYMYVVCEYVLFTPIVCLCAVSIGHSNRKDTNINSLSPCFILRFKSIYLERYVNI